MEATRGTVVTSSYTLKNDKGHVLDASDRAFDYLHGYGNIIPGLERALEGARAGFQEVVVVEPADAYGVSDPDAVFKVPLGNFPAEMQIAPGMDVLADTPSGSIRLRVCEIDEEHVMVDANHPLAGMRLHFDVEVVAVRAASSEELAQGCPR